nr:MAG TPA: 2,3,4,5-tetrahydropyridine-2,6-dicarboxylate N-succinyltransferase [Caudoviricetes sp.]
MAKKYGVASDYIKYTSRIKSDTSDGVAVEASQVVDLEEDKLQSDINKELKASIASASGNTYSKSEIDSKDSATLTSAKSYADTKKTEAVSAAATDATTKANSALASAKSYADQKVSALGSVYTTKGSCTAAQLKALTSAKAGDVWNITDAVTIDGKAYPAGVNVVCVTAFSAAIDPATTKNWDALQGLQDLTSYAKWSQVEEAAISDVEFERDVAGEDNSYTFKKTLTYVGGTKREVDFGISLDPATSTKAGVMSAADKVKLDAVDGRIQGVKIIDGSGIYEGLFKIDNLNGTKSVLLGSGANIFSSLTIGTSVWIDRDIQIHNEGKGFQLKSAHFGTEVIIKDNVGIGSNVGIGENVELSNAKIGTATIGTSLQKTHEDFADKIAIGNGVQICKGVGIAIDDDGILNWGRDMQGSYTIKKAATTDDLSALASRVSALEDLLKLA